MGVLHRLVGQGTGSCLVFGWLSAQLTGWQIGGLLVVGLDGISDARMRSWLPPCGDIKLFHSCSIPSPSNRSYCTFWAFNREAPYASAESLLA